MGEMGNQKFIYLIIYLSIYNVKNFYLLFGAIRL